MFQSLRMSYARNVIHVHIRGLIEQIRFLRGLRSVKFTVLSLCPYLTSPTAERYYICEKVKFTTF